MRESSSLRCEENAMPPQELTDLDGDVGTKFQRSMDGSLFVFVGAFMLGGASKRPGVCWRQVVASRGRHSLRCVVLKRIHWRRSHSRPRAPTSASPLTLPGPDLKHDMRLHSIQRRGQLVASFTVLRRVCPPPGQACLTEGHCLRGRHIAGCRVYEELRNASMAKQFRDHRRSPPITSTEKCQVLRIYAFVFLH